MRPEKRMRDTPHRTQTKVVVVRSIISLLALITVNYAVMLEHPTNLDDVSWNDTKTGIVFKEVLTEHSNSDQHVHTHVRRNVPTLMSILGVEHQELLSILTIVFLFLFIIIIVIITIVFLFLFIIIIPTS